MAKKKIGRPNEERRARQLLETLEKKKSAKKSGQATGGQPAKVSAPAGPASSAPPNLPGAAPTNNPPVKKPTP